MICSNPWKIAVSESFQFDLVHHKEQTVGKEDWLGAVSALKTRSEFTKKAARVNVEMLDAIKKLDCEKGPQSVKLADLLDICFQHELVFGKTIYMRKIKSKINSLLVEAKAQKTIQLPTGADSSKWWAKIKVEKKVKDKVKKDSNGEEPKPQWMLLVKRKSKKITTTKN